MKLQYLGTAAAEAVPALFCTCAHCAYARLKCGKELRARSSALVDNTLLIDFGPDAYLNALRYGIDYTPLRTLLITHSHADHFSPAELSYRKQGFAQLRPDDVPLTVYGNATVGERLSPYFSSSLQFCQVRSFQTFETQGYRITPLEAVHCVSQQNEQYAVITESQTLWRSEEAFIYLIEKNGKALLYAHDTDELTQRNLDFLSGHHLDIVSLDCNNGAWECDYIGHMEISGNLRMQKRLLQCGIASERTIFVANHFSHNGLIPYEQLEAQLPGFVVSYDGLVVETA